MIYEILDFNNKLLPLIMHKSFIDCRAEAQLNWHEDLELLYFINSNGIVQCNSKRTRATTDDLFIVNSDYLHTISTDCTTDTANYYCLIIKKDFLLDNGIDISKLCFFDLVHDLYIKPIIHELLYELSKRDRFFEIRVRCLILKLMMYLTINYSVEKQSNDYSSSQIMQTIKAVVQRIKQTSSEKITIDEIVDFAGFSRAYFSREFKAATGFTIIEYLNNIRCTNAKNMLATGQYTVNQAAELCGYDNLSYFTKMYKIINNTLPSKDIPKNQK